MKSKYNKLKYLSIFLLLTPLSIHADSWTGEDKVFHFGGGLAISTLGTLGTERKEYGFGIGCLAGLAKEISDRNGTGFSVKDLTVTCAGALLGAYVGGWMLTAIKQGQKTTVTVSRSF